MDLEQVQHDYQKALRAWHVAWQARVDWHREHFYPLTLASHLQRQVGAVAERAHGDHLRPREATNGPRLARLRAVDRREQRYP